jgi:copper chaperone
MHDCAATCEYAGKCQFRTISIKGMTCGGCEQSVTTALTATPGVLKVVSVNYKTGTAVVCIDPTKVEDKVITTAVSNTGFEAQIIPAVATTTTTGTEAKACGSTTTTGAKDACCKAGKTSTETKATTTASKDTKNPL